MSGRRRPRAGPRVGRSAGRRAGPRRAAGGVVALVLLGGLALSPWGSARDAGADPDRTPPPARPTAPYDAAVSALLAERGAAVLTGDARRWMRTVDPSDPAAARAEAGRFARLAQLPVAQWDYALDPARGAAAAGAGTAGVPAGDRRRSERSVRVRLLYRLDGYDTRPVRRDLHLTVVAGPGGRALVRGAPRAAAGDRGADPWDLGPVRVHRGEGTLVVARTPLPGGEAELRRVVRDAETAVRRVAAGWPGRWPGRVVVVVPRTPAEMASVLGRPEAGLAQLAAVTTGQSGPPGSPPAGERVVLHPSTFPGLTDVGRRVVLTHETTHVATRALGGRPVPLWLSEGFADEVAYRHEAVPPAVAAGPLLEQVRAGALPAALPGERDFDTGAGTLGTPYEQAWTACRLIADVHGEAGLVAFYRAVQRGGVERAFADALSTTQEAFVEQWRARLLRDAGGRR